MLLYGDWRVVLGVRTVNILDDVTESGHCFACWSLGEVYISLSLSLTLYSLCTHSLYSLTQGLVDTKRQSHCTSTALHAHPTLSNKTRTNPITSWRRRTKQSVDVLRHVVATRGRGDPFSFDRVHQCNGRVKLFYFKVRSCAASAPLISPSGNVATIDGDVVAFN